MSAACSVDDGPGYGRGVKAELFLLAVTTILGEDTYYEVAGQRDSRYVELIHAATLDDPEWTARLLAWLRGTANMRSAAIVGAAEFARARQQAGLDGLSRQVIDSVLRRADEPGLVLDYWIRKFGRAIPKPVKRGVADAVRRLYNEHSLLKYDRGAFRFGDVIDLVHPRNDGPVQAALYQHALDRRHKRDTPIPADLVVLTRRQALMAIPWERRRSAVRAPGGARLLSDAGMTWESLAGWLQGPVNAPEWQALIPSMGYLALLRNLRNFDAERVSDSVAAEVAARLADPVEVARSRQLPLRFLAAHRAGSARWSSALEQAITHSLGNVPALSGRTLVMVDTSSSMKSPLTRRSSLMRWDAAALFGIALGLRCQAADVVSFSGGRERTLSRDFPLDPAESLVRAVDRWQSGGYFLNGGTDTAPALVKHFAGHDRVVVVTDEQAYYGDVDHAVPRTVPMYTWNLGGYEFGHVPSASVNRYAFGGLTDHAFELISRLEAGQAANWPF